MTPIALKHGLSELRQARAQSRSLYWSVALFSAFVNLLMLTGPIYMLNVYDRVLGSRSEETLLALTILVVFLYGMMGVLDFVRSRILGRIAARLQSTLDSRVFDAVMRRSVSEPQNPQAATGLRDLEAVQRYIGSPALAALFDLPWTPVFLLGIFIFHPLLGALALGGGLVLVALLILNQWLSKAPLGKTSQATVEADRISEQFRDEAELVQSLGMSQAAFNRWNAVRNVSLSSSIHSGDVTGTFSSLTKVLRLFLQSAMLGLGAYLVLQNQLTPGAMIAASILLGRALAPIEATVSQWQVTQRARQGWRNLAILLGHNPSEPPRTELPRPKAALAIDKLTLVPPGDTQAALKLVSAAVLPGQALGVIGQSGAGKSTLARAITGVWKPASGSIRLDGAKLENYPADDLGSHIGYLPQRVQLFDGTIAENIARLRGDSDDGAIVTAAKRAAAHDMILQLPDGYDSKISAVGGRLSGGQIQRIGLARALYGDPVVLVLDEPNSNLDNQGSTALNTAIKQTKANGGAVIVMAHRPAAIQECDVLLVLDQGMTKAFGPKNEVLKKVLANAAEVQGNAGNGGVS